MDQGDRGRGGAKNQEIIQELYLNTGGLVGAVTSVEGTGQLVTGTRNDESGWSALPPGTGREKTTAAAAAAAAAASLGNRLTVHTIRDTGSRVLGLGSSSSLRAAGTGGGGGGEGGDDDAVVGRLESVAEAWAPHEGAVTGVDLAGGGFENLGGVSGVVTSGGDGCLRLFELTPGDDFDEGEDEDGSPGDGPSLGLVGQVSTHSDRATGVAATRRRAVTVGEDGVASVVDLQRLVDDGGGGGGVGGGEAVGLVWTGRTKGAMPLSGVTFQGESEEVFATVGCDPRGQLLLWDARTDGSRPVIRGTLGCIRGSEAPYLCVASQPFTPEVFACGVSTGEVVVWDVRTGAPLHELQAQNETSAGGGSWGVAFHPRSPRHLFSCSGTGVLTKWYVPPEGQAPQPAAVGGGGVFGGGWGDDGWESLRGARHLYELPSRSGLVGVCYDETADMIAAVSKHGHVVVAHGVAGLRL